MSASAVRMRELSRPVPQDDGRVALLGGDQVDPHPERRPEERGVPHAEDRAQELAVAGDLLGDLAVAEGHQVRVGPRVVAQRHLPRLDEGPEHRRVLLPGPVTAVREEGQPRSGLGCEGGERGDDLGVRAVVDGEGERRALAGQGLHHAGGPQDRAGHRHPGGAHRSRGERRCGRRRRSRRGLGTDEAGRASPHGRTGQAGGERQQESSSVHG
jgi:hypothetical protein